MNLRPARPQDAPVLSAIAHAAKRYWGYPEECLRRWSAALTITEPYLSGSSTWVATVDSRMVGFGSATQEGETATLDHLWVRPEAMGRGIGRALFTHLEHVMLLAGATLLKATADPHAEAFYRKLGMRRIAEKPAPIEGQPDRVLPLMEKALTQRRG